MKDKKGAKKVSEKKVQKVKEISELIQKYPTIGIADLHSLPAKQQAKIKSKLRGKATIILVKKRLLKRALEKVPGFEKLINYLNGMTALVLSNMNAFELFAELKRNRTKAPAKAGQVAPLDIIVLAGQTPFAPGPILSQLGEIGIKASIDKGKVVIKEDSLVLKKGDVFSEAKANILSRLDIAPIDIGVNLIAVLDNGEMYEKSILDVDTEEFIRNIQTACSDAFKLALELAIPTQETITLLIKRAALDAEKLAVGANILTVKQTLAKAEAEVHALSSKIRG